MDQYKGLTDKELIARLKKYSIPHGPVVGTTRKLYEKKVYEYETERTQRPPLGGYEGHEDHSTTQSYLRESYTSPRNEEDFDYEREDPSPSRSYMRQTYSFPQDERRSTYGAKNWDGDVSEDSYSSSRLYGAALSSGGHLGAATTRQPIGEPLYSAARQEATATGRDSGTYQSVWQRQAPSPASSLGLQPRRAIRPELQTPAAAGGGSGAGSRRFLPLWLQLLVFLLLAAFLGYAYFYLQGGDDNPFRPYLQN